MSKQLRFGFGGGEISEELWSRLDLGKYPVGLKRCENFLVVPHGPVVNRPGTYFENQGKTALDGGIRLLTFQSSQSNAQDFCVEFGEGYMRFALAGGGYLALNDDPGSLVAGITGRINSGATAYWPSEGDWVYISQVGTNDSDSLDTNKGRRALEGRWVIAGTGVFGEFFRFKDLRGYDIDTSGYGNVSLRWSRIFEIEHTYSNSHLFEVEFSQKHDVMTLTHPGYPPAELRYNPIADPARPFSMSVVSFAPTVATPPAPTVEHAVPTTIGSPVTNFYRVTALKQDSLEESLPSPAGSIATDLSIAGNYNRIIIHTVPNAVRYNVYKLKNGLYGFMAQTEIGPVIDDNIVPDMSKTIPYPSMPFVGAGNYPSVTMHYQGRRLFAATDNLPQNFWLTVSGTISNLSYSIPTRDDDSIASAIDGDQVHRIRHAVQLGDLLFLTNAGEWKLATPRDEVLTPANAFPKQDGSEGCTQLLRPVVASASVVYGAANQRRLNKLEYSWQNSAYVVEDISILAPHLFDDTHLIDLTMTKTPYRFIWSVRDDGILLCLTYHPEHEVKAWHRHSTPGAQGKFRAVTKLRNGPEDELWCVTRRTILGSEWNYIERFAQRRFGPSVPSVQQPPNPQTFGAYFVDCGGKPTKIVPIIHIET